MACEEDFIDCNNDELGFEQLFRLLLAKLPSGEPAVRVCDGSGGGGGGEFPLPIGNFVFVNPLGNDATGERENFHKPFQTLNGAKNVASPMTVTGVTQFTPSPASGTTPLTEYATTGGTGVGLTVQYTEGFFGIQFWTVVNAGSGYTNGDVVEVTASTNDFQLQLQTTPAEDTIFVYGGTYNEANQLYKENVKWHFVGHPTVNVSASNVFEVPANGYLDIKGNADFNHVGIGRFIRVLPTSTDAKVFLECQNLTGNGQHVLYFQAGSGQINIKEKLEVTLVNRCIQLGGTASYTFNIDDIFCNSIVGGVSNAINLQNQSPVYAGTSIFNCRIIRSERANGSTISSQYGALTGTAIFNVTEKIHFGQTSPPPHSDSAVAVASGNVIINGDIDGGVGHAIDMHTVFFDKYCEHNGKATNDGTLELISNGDTDSGFWSVGNGVLKLNGEYKSANEIVVRTGGNVDFSTGLTIFMNGRIESEYAGVGNNYGVFVEAQAPSTIFESVVIIMTDNGNPECVGSPIAKDIKIFRDLGSNKNAGVNISNLIVANNLTVDTDFE